MSNILYLTSEEMALAKKKISADLLKKWELKAEHIDAFESADELKKRMKEADFDKFPGVKEFVAHLATQTDMSKISFDKFPEEAVPTLMYVMGASGLSYLIAHTLQEEELDDDGLKNLALITSSRHKILMTNVVLAQ